MRPSAIDRRPGLDWLDEQPARVAVPIGVAAGAALGALALMTLPLGAVGFLGLVLVGGWLAVSARPVSVRIEPVRRALAAPASTEEDAAAPRSGGSQADPLAYPPALVDIPDGQFRMGSEDDDPSGFSNEQPAHVVEIDAFQCMPYPVTRALYARIMSLDPGYPPRGEDDEPIERDGRAANGVTWFDAVAFCNRLSEQRGLRPCYKIEERGGNELPDVRWDETADGYRLPTEAEWEYVCRAGASTRYYFGDDEDGLDAHAWVGMEFDAGAQLVGEKLANRWGLYDVHGNVWEWCWDWFDSEWYAFCASSELVRNPSGPSSGEGRVMRGGSFDYPAWFARCANRFWFPPVDGDGVTGFRCVRGPRRQQG